MAEINVNGRMLVKNFKKQFQEAFGCSLRVYVKTHFADDEQTLASLREEGKKGGELSVKGNMLVGNFEAKMLEEYGITVQVANIDDTKLVDNNLTLAAAGRGEERKAAKKTEKVVSNKPETDTKPTAVEQPQASQPAEGEKKQFKVVLTGTAICNAPVCSHEDCNETTLDGGYSTSDIWEGLYGSNPILDCCNLDEDCLCSDESLSLNVQHVKMSDGTELNTDITFKMGPCEYFDKPCTDEDYVGLLECKFTATIQLELLESSNFDINKLEVVRDEYSSIIVRYEGEPIQSGFAFELIKLIGYTDGKKEYEHSYEAPVTLRELVDKYQGAVLEINLLVERDEDGEFADDEAGELYNDNHWEYKIKGHQLVNEWSEERFDINGLDEPCLEEEMATKLSNILELDCWSHLESGYDVEASLYETDEGGNYIDRVCRYILPEAYL